MGYELFSQLALAPGFRHSPEASRFISGPLFGGLGLGLALVAGTLALLAWSRSRRLAERVAGPERGLRPGPVLLRGVAEAADADGEGGPLIALSIEQVGTQHRNKSSRYVRWVEVSRTLTERPFLLRTERGEIVRVEPGGRLDLVDQLEPPRRGPGPDRRQRQAKISAGDRLWLGGVLERRGGEAASPYRGGGGGYVLRPEGRRPLFVSSEPVENEGRAGMRFHRAFALLGLTALAVSQGLIFRDFHALEARGQRGLATIIAHRSWISRSKNTVTHHYAMTLRYEVDGRSFEAEEETNQRAYTLIGVGKTVPITYLPANPSTVQLGRDGELGTTTGRTTMAALIHVLILTCYAVIGAGRRPWWRRRKLVETEPGTL